MKRRRLLIGILFLLVLLVAISARTVYREVQQQRLNHDLIAALKKGDVSAEIRLLNAGADANAKDMGDTSISFKAVLWDYWRRLRTGKAEEKEFHKPALLLTIVHAPVIQTSEDVFWNNVRIAMIHPLLDHGADINSQDKEGDTLLWYACTLTRPRLARMLIQRGANVNSADIEGYTPLIQAIGSDDPNLIKMLLKAGANINAKDRQGLTALSWAKSYSRKRAALVLQQAGAHE